MGIEPVPWKEQKVLRKLKEEFKLGAAKRVKIIAGGMSGQCYKNCDAYAQENEGKVIYGWLAKGLPGKFLVLEHHAIVKMKDGSYADPTKFNGSEFVEVVVFIDNSITPSRDYPPFIPNKYLGYVGHESALEAFRRAEEYEFELRRRTVREAQRQGLPWMSGVGVPGLQNNLEVRDIVRGFEFSKRLQEEAAQFY